MSVLIFNCIFTPKRCTKTYKDLFSLYLICNLYLICIKCVYIRKKLILLLKSWK